MAHRSRSKTADSTESKKTKGTPRRLTEKIAIMRRKEHEQSEAFEQAMKSIFEVRREAYIHVFDVRRHNHISKHSSYSIMLSVVKTVAEV